MIWNVKWSNRSIWFFISLERVSQLGTFFLSELGDGFSVFFFGDLLVLDASPVDLDSWIEAFAFDTTLVNTWVVVVCSTIVSSTMRSLSAFLDTINIATCSLWNRFEGVGSVLPDLLPSLFVAFNCSSKSVSNNSTCFVCQFFIVGFSSLEFSLSAIETFSEGWAVTLSSSDTLFGLVHILLWWYTV